MSIDLFSDAFHVPCKFVHDAECACTSELWENPDITDATYISLGYHLGGAIIVDGQLLTGATGKSGTFEHMTLVPNGLDCYCGRKGCAECYCSGNSLLSDCDNLDEFFPAKPQAIRPALPNGMNISGIYPSSSITSIWYWNTR